MPDFKTKISRCSCLISVSFSPLADCPKPQTRGDVVLTDNALLMNTFPKGVEVTLECANGFVEDSGSGVITCVDDNWTKPDLTCKSKSCPL